MPTSYKVFRGLAYICLLVIIVIAVLFFFGVGDDKVLAVLSGLIAIFAAIFGIFAAKPIDEKDVMPAVDRVMMTYESKTYENLQKALEEKKQAETFVDYINHKSEEMFYVKLRQYLNDEIISKYDDSELAKLVDELEKVEARLDLMKVHYESIMLPERFKKIVKELDRREQLNFYLDILDAMPLGPFREASKVYLRSMFYRRS